MERYVSLSTPSKIEHGRIKTFVAENSIEIVSESITRDHIYSIVILKLTDAQYDDLIFLSLNSKIEDLT